MKVLVCGSSRYQDEDALFRALDDLHGQTPVTLIINGGARGADYLASKWARMRGIECAVFKTDTHRFGPNAFFTLNALMLAQHKPDLVLAFPGGDITADMISRARQANIPVRIAGQE